MNRIENINLVFCQPFFANANRLFCFFANTQKPTQKKQKSLFLNALLKIVIILALFLSTHKTVYGQELSIEDAIVYLEDVVNKDLLKQDNIYDGTRKIDFSIYDDEIVIKYIWENNKEVLNYEFQEGNINYNEITFDISKISEIFINTYKTRKVVSLRCKDGTKNCFKMENEALKINFSKEFSDRPSAYNHYDFIHLFYLKNEETQEKVFIALNYILFELNRLKNQEQDLTLNQIISGSNTKREIVDLKKQSGVSYLTIDIGGIKTSVILDSGASDVSISKKFEKRLLENEIIETKNYLTPGLYTIADGSVVKSDRFIIPYIKINNTIIKNVRCSVNNSKDVILLGKSFLDRFKSWEINNESNKLILKI
jgi:clan AA aspartic protease (TIGR02281 family)